MIGKLTVLIVMIVLTVASCVDEENILETVVVHDFEESFLLVFREQSELDLISSTLENAYLMDGQPNYGVPAPYTATLHYSNGDVILVSMYVQKELPTFGLVYNYEDEGYRTLKKDTVLIKELFKMTE